MAAGAGSVTKLLRMNEEEGVITGVDRVEDVKNVDQYMDRIDEMIERKREATEGMLRFS